MKPIDRVCILGYDGLDIELVEQFNLPNLKQEEYGKVDISEFDLIATPILWGSFITGENLSSELTEKPRIKPLENIFRTPYQFLKKSISPKLASKAINALKKTGLVQKVRGKASFGSSKVKEMDKGTIFDFLKNSLGINIPAYNKTRGANASMKDVLENRISESEYWKAVWKEFEVTRKELMENLDKDLVMAWFSPADLNGHIWRGNAEKMRETYSRLDEFAEEVRDRFDGLVLIVADHGMKPLGKFGDHTNVDYGYYSSNIELELNSPEITDFYHVILSLLEGNYQPSEYKRDKKDKSRREEEFEGDEEEEIKKRLESLGYFD